MRSALRDHFPWFFNMSDSRALFQSDLYTRHNARRLEHLASLHLDLEDRTVLELGAGIGDHSTFFLDRGCRVTAIEPRSENVAVIRSRMSLFPSVWDPNRLTVVQAAVEDLDALHLEPHDVVYCYGLLYHLAEPLAALRSAARACRAIFLLETKVRLPEQDANLVEDSENVTNAVTGAVALMTRADLGEALSDLFPHVYETTVVVAHEQFPHDWGSVAPDRWPLRTVFVASREPLTSPWLRNWRRTAGSAEGE
jgi:SAM-dependent methyltransferase